jgi:hypothetical protein
MTAHGEGQEFISMPASSDEIWPLPSLQSNRYSGDLPGIKGLNRESDRAFPTGTEFKPSKTKLNYVYIFSKFRAVNTISVVA